MYIPELPRGGRGVCVVLTGRGKHCEGGMVTDEALRNTSGLEIIIRKQREAGTHCALVESV